MDYYEASLSELRADADAETFAELEWPGLEPSPEELAEAEALLAFWESAAAAA